MQNSNHSEPTLENNHLGKNSLDNSTKNKSIIQAILAPTIAILPLSLSVTPWGILCGTLAIEAGMSSWQAQLMSLAVFAGAVQISGIALLGVGGSWLSLLNSTAMISVRHVLYSASYKEDVIKLPLIKRLLFAFLLTDEMFVVAKAQQIKTGKFDYWFAVIAGFVFYLVWNIATFIGIYSANLFSNIDELGFDFAIAATFIAMVVPLVKQSRGNAMLIAVVISAVATLVFAVLNIEQGLVFSALLGMTVGAMLNRFKRFSEESNHD